MNRSGPEVLNSSTASAPGHGESLRRSFGVKMHLIRLENRFKHRERIQVLDRHADADQLRPARGFREQRTLRQECLQAIPA